MRHRRRFFSPEFFQGFKEGLLKAVTGNPVFKRFRKVELKRIKRLDAPNPTGFHQVANYLIENDRVDDAEEIFKLHEQHFADDPWLAHFRAEALIIRRQFAEAAAIFEPLLSRPLPDDLRGKCRDEYLVSMFLAGKTLEAYRAVPDDAAVAFRRLGDRLVNAENVELE